MEENNIYTTLEDAKVEIQRRWNDRELRKKVEEYLNGNIPNAFTIEPKAVLGRPIMTPDIEHFHFLAMAKFAGLKPISWEYTKDKFYTINTDKLGLAKMSFFNGVDENGEDVISVEKVVDFKNAEGKIFREMNTIWDENFVDFHHRILREMGSDVEIFDGSDWYMSMGKNAKEYYKYYLAMFVCHGVLFENFVIGDDVEEKFTKNVFLPAFQGISEIFGVKPLIIPAIPSDELGKESWWCYPYEVKSKIKIQ